MSNILHVRSHMPVTSIYLIISMTTWTVTIDIYMETIPKNLAKEWLKETKNECFSEILLFFKQNGNYPGDKN